MRQLLTLTAKGADGSVHTFTGPLALTLTRGMDTPAHSLQITFAREGGPLPPLLTAELYQGGQALFRGYCDQQTEEAAPAGRTLALSARSRGGLLLDNEALPQTYYGASTRDIFRAHILPYGIGQLEVPRVLTAGTFQVSKGLSEWEVFCAFCIRMYARLPWVDSQDRVLVRPPDPTPCTLISNDPGVPSVLQYFSLARVLRRSSVVSQIIIRDKKGNYSSPVNNTAQRHLAVRRRRYVIPAAEYQTTPAADAFQRMQKSNLGFFSLVATVPGFSGVDVGDGVRVVDPICGDRVLTAYQLHTQLNPDGLRTRITLADPDYL